MVQWMLHGLHTSLLVLFGFFVAGSAGYCAANILDILNLDRTLSGAAGAIAFGIVVVLMDGALFKNKR